MSLSVFILVRVKRGSTNKVFTTKNQSYYFIEYSINSIFINLHIFLVTDVSFYWFEIFSNIGGLCGVVGGFSLIGFTEIFYFMLKQLFLLVMRKLKVTFKSRNLIIYP